MKNENHFRHSKVIFCL